MCDLKVQWICDKSVARIWPLKTEKPSAYVTVNCKGCRIVITLYYLWSRVVWMYKVSINPIIQSKTHLISHPTHDSMFCVAWPGVEPFGTWCASPNCSIPLYHTIGTVHIVGTVSFLAGIVMVRTQVTPCWIISVVSFHAISHFSHVSSGDATA
jgi:hypothetical protein